MSPLLMKVGRWLSLEKAEAGVGERGEGKEQGEEVSELD